MPINVYIGQKWAAVSAAVAAAAGRAPAPNAGSSLVEFPSSSTFPSSSNYPRS